ncbi:glutamic acid-rich protein-like [Dendronephthya gigantea]|uniref:glutamic acid-rich protein-like n=1 Tax=Dendronephthya gigantea TaxID=151771 RepID=UPI001069F7BB|nr:glutamic acid-rich protein-like [Dendronephthya gigantea]
MKTIKLLSILLVAMACVSAVNCEEEGSYYDDNAPKVENDYAKNADVSADRSLAGEEYDDDVKGEETEADEYLTEDNEEQTEVDEDEAEADDYKTEADGEETGKDTTRGITADLSNGEQDDTKRGEYSKHNVLISCGIIHNSIKAKNC